MPTRNTTHSHSQPAPPSPPAGGGQDAEQRGEEGDDDADLQQHTVGEEQQDEPPQHEEAAHEEAALVESAPRNEVQVVSRQLYYQQSMHSVESNPSPPSAFTFEPVHEETPDDDERESPLYPGCQPTSPYMHFNAWQCADTPPSESPAPSPDPTATHPQVAPPSLAPSGVEEGDPAGARVSQHDPGVSPPS